MTDRDSLHRAVSDWVDHEPVGLFFLHRDHFGKICFWEDRILKLKEMEPSLKAAVERLVDAFGCTKLEIRTRSGKADRVVVTRPVSGRD